MKLIVDIPEEQYNDIVKYLTDNDGNYAYSDFNLREIIRNGTPYNPSGDCISREALKEQVKNEVCEVCFTSPEERQCSPNCKLCTYKELIDNAPPVVDCKNCDGYEAGYSAGMRDTERTQGEWIIIKSPLSNETIVKCDKCGDEFIGNDVEDYNFCPNCGADMRDRDKSLCSTCVFGDSCNRSDKMVSWANHSVCFGYVKDESEKGGAE